MAFAAGKQRRGTNKYAGGLAFVGKVDPDTGVFSDTQWWQVGILKDEEISHATPLENDFDDSGTNYPNPGNTTSEYTYTLMQRTKDDLTFAVFDTSDSSGQPLPFAVIIEYSKTRIDSAGTKWQYLLYPYVYVEQSLKRKAPSNTIPVKLVALPAIAAWTATTLNGISGTRATLTTGGLTVPSGNYFAFINF